MKSDENVGHRDQHAIDFWFRYGPTNVEIEPSPRTKLSLKRGLRLHSIVTKLTDSETLKKLGASKEDNE